MPARGTRERARARSDARAVRATRGAGVGRARDTHRAARSGREEPSREDSEVVPPRRSSKSATSSSPSAPAPISCAGGASVDAGGASRRRSGEAGGLTPVQAMEAGSPESEDAASSGARDTSGKRCFRPKHTPLRGSGHARSAVSHRQRGARQCIERAAVMWARAKRARCAPLRSAEARRACRRDVASARRTTRCTASDKWAAPRACGAAASAARRARSVSTRKREYLRARHCRRRRRRHRPTQTRAHHCVELTQPQLSHGPLRFAFLARASASGSAISPWWHRGAAMPCCVPPARRARSSVAPAVRPARTCGEGANGAGRGRRGARCHVPRVVVVVVAAWATHGISRDDADRHVT
jgi:hypothetical protein